MGIIGYGAVAAVHAAQLAKLSGVTKSVVCGPDRAKAEAFAAAHDIGNVATGIGTALPLMDAAIVCSPTRQHYAQTLELLHAGRWVLVELPACESECEAVWIGEAAKQSSVVCAHTSRYLRPYRMLQQWISGGILGSISHVHYIRHIPPRSRSWTDDALIHHAAHVLDLLLHWFGSVQPAACMARPSARLPQDLAIVARAGEETLVTIDISYTSRVPQLAMTVSGDRHSVVTDGFSFIRSDAQELVQSLDEQCEYEHAVFAQDRDFIQGSGIPWEETIRLAGLTDRLRVMGERI